MQTANSHRKHWNNIRNGIDDEEKSKKDKRAKKESKKLKIILNNQPMNVLFVLIYVSNERTMDAWTFFFPVSCVLYSVLKLSVSHFDFFFFFTLFTFSVAFNCFVCACPWSASIDWIELIKHWTDLFFVRLFNFQLKDIHLQSRKEYEE